MTVNHARKDQQVNKQRKIFQRQLDAVHRGRFFEESAGSYARSECVSATTPYRGERMPVTAAQVAMVRKALDEKQTEFACRFSRSSFAIIRWEKSGAVFRYGSRRYEVWHCAINEAIFRTTLRSKGTDHEQIENLQALRIL